MCICLAEYPPKVAVSNLINNLKGISNRLLRKGTARYSKTLLEWLPSYFSSSCDGAPISTVHQYIKQQQTPY